MTDRSVDLSGLCRALDLGDAPDEVLRIVREVYEEVDAAVTARSSGLALPCRAGCDACCHEAVFVSAPEFFAVAADLLTRRSEAERATLVQQMCAIAERFEDELELLEALPAGPERDEVAGRVKFACPLLDDRGCCSVYGARELNARTFGAAWDPVRDRAYGCDLTVGRLAVLPVTAGPGLYDARAGRRLLVQRVHARVPAFDAQSPVRVYPWWFRRFSSFLAAR